MKSQLFLDTLRKRSTTHGHAPRGKQTKGYQAWANMIQRCTNPKNTYWGNYGGRGINVCDRWREYANFLIDMGEPPPKLTLERRNVNDDYGPDNCFWATRKEQAFNRRLDRHRATAGDLMVSYLSFGV